MEFMLVGIGGMFGSVARYRLGRIISERTRSGLPLGTFMINMSGAFLLGIVSSINPGKNLYLLLSDGFLGGYTTFSTFMYENFSLLQKNEKLNAFIYISGSILLGTAGYFTGFMLGKLF